MDESQAGHNHERNKTKTSFTKSRSAKSGWVTSDQKLTGKTVVITGANTGIGLETAVDMAERDAKLIIACRDPRRGESALKHIVAETGSQRVRFSLLDLSSFSSVRQFVENFKNEEQRLDILINNAGIMMCPQSTTQDGFETHFGVNHLGHFLLTYLLLDLIKASAPSRIITLSSVMHRRLYNAHIHWNDLNLKKSYNARDAYSQSKLMNVLFSRELAKRLEGTGVTTYCVHPGLVNTKLVKYAGTHGNCWDTLFGCVTKSTKGFWKTPRHGAQTTIYCAIAPELENETGKYYSECKKAREASSGRDDGAACKLWEISMNLVEQN
uniref:retinol dehydrogenase 12-like n=1 Tax=Styela clava TaxID=7725 RepID=UPI0019392787|nr:retinol dehydrogenase 12-like [Styela clava]